MATTRVSPEPDTLTEFAPYTPATGKRYQIYFRTGQTYVHHMSCEWLTDARTHVNDILQSFGKELSIKLYNAATQQWVKIPR